MPKLLATVQRDNFLQEIDQRGFGLCRAYEAFLEGCFLDGELEVSDRGPASSVVHVFQDGLDIPLLGRDADLWETGPDSSLKMSRYQSLRATMEVEKRKDPSFPDGAVPWDGSKREAAYTFGRIAGRLGLAPPIRLGETLVFSLGTSVGTLGLNLDTGGRPKLAGRLPIHYYFEPTQSSSIFLSDLRWAHPALEEYFRFVTGGIGEDGVRWTSVDECSAVHGVQASLVFLQTLANHLT